RRRCLGDDSWICERLSADKFYSVPARFGRAGLVGASVSAGGYARLVRGGRAHILTRAAADRLALAPVRRLLRDFGRLDRPAALDRGPAPQMGGYLSKAHGGCSCRLNHGRLRDKDARFRLCSYPHTLGS